MKKILVFLVLGLVSAFSVKAASVPLVIDSSRSKVEVVVKVTMDSFVGKLETYRADIHVDSVSSQIESCTFSFKFSDVKTGKEDRDRKMNEWQDTEKNPDGVFVLDRFERPADGRTIAVGKLTLHGIEKTLRFPVTIESKDGQYTISGEPVVVTTAYELPVIKMMGLMKVDPKVGIRFVLVGFVKADK